MARKSKPTGNRKYKKRTLSTKSTVTKAVNALVSKNTKKSYGSLPRTLELLVNARPEVKHYDTILTHTNSGFDMLYKLSALVGLTQGTGASQRIGSRIRVLSVTVNYNLFWNPATVPSAATNPRSIAWTALVHDKQPNGLAFTAAQVNTGVWDDTNNLVSGMQQRCAYTYQRFRVLDLKSYTFNGNCIFPASTLANYTQGQVAHQSMYCTFKGGLPVQFDAAGGAISDLNQNNIVVCIGTGGTDDNIQWEGTCRVRYIDA